jgi:dipeptidase E
VLGLREGCILHIQDGSMKLIGSKPVRIFRFGKDPVEMHAGEDLSMFLT